MFRVHAASALVFILSVANANAATLLATALAKKDPIRVYTEQVNVSWGDSNIMNDAGVKLLALEFEGEHGESAVPIKKDDAINGAKDLFSEIIFDEYGSELAKGLKPRDLKIKVSAVAFSAEYAMKALKFIAIEGFGYGPTGLDKTLNTPIGDPDDKSYTMLGTFQGILKKLAISPKTGAIIRLDTSVSRSDGVTEKFTQFVFLNHKTGLFLNVFVRHAEAE